MVKAIVLMVVLTINDVMMMMIMIMMLMVMFMMIASVDLGDGGSIVVVLLR